ncbi:MAG: hypothetical protein Q9222_006769 [Ikaeria aurantiellina]
MRKVLKGASKMGLLELQRLALFPVPRYSKTIEEALVTTVSRVRTVALTIADSFDYQLPLDQKSQTEIDMSYFDLDTIKRDENTLREAAKEAEDYAVYLFALIKLIDSRRDIVMNARSPRTIDQDGQTQNKPPMIWEALLCGGLNTLQSKIEALGFKLYSRSKKIQNLMVNQTITYYNVSDEDKSILYDALNKIRSYDDCLAQLLHLIATRFNQNCELSNLSKFEDHLSVSVVAAFKKANLYGEWMDGPVHKMNAMRCELDQLKTQMLRHHVTKQFAYDIDGKDKATLFDALCQSGSFSRKLKKLANLLLTRLSLNSGIQNSERHTMAEAFQQSTIQRRLSSNSQQPIMAYLKVNPDTKKFDSDDPIIYSGRVASIAQMYSFSEHLYKLARLLESRNRVLKAIYAGLDPRGATNPLDAPSLASDIDNLINQCTALKVKICDLYGDVGRIGYNLELRITPVESKEVHFQGGGVLF